MAKSFHALASPPLPKRIFKLAVESESKAFIAAGKIASELDKADGFVHLSDRTSVPVVARLFFTTAADLKLLELDAEKLHGVVKTVPGKMGDPGPNIQVRAHALTRLRTHTHTHAHAHTHTPRVRWHTYLKAANSCRLGRQTNLK